MFQQDGASAHRGGIVKKYLNDNSTKLLPWPAQSPDINIIENLWAFVKRDLKDNYDRAEDLKADIMGIWEEVEDHYIDALFRSMLDRLKVITKSKGGPTMY